MIKGLYFKLNMDKQADKDIYNFFIQESKKCSVNKIDLLFSMMLAYMETRGTKDLMNCIQALVNITEHECYTYGEDDAVAFAKGLLNKKYGMMHRKETQ